MVCQDDKRKIPIGEPYNPVSDGHNRQAPQFLDGQHGALDHTISKMSITPSCNFFNTVPTSTAGSFYNGSAVITLKDSVWQPSNPMRHTREFLDELYERYDFENESESPKVLMKYHDGGSDHNDTNAWAQLATIIEWISTGVDLLVSERCVPGQSYINPAERVFASLNLALQVASLERTVSEPEVEQLIKHAGSMNQIRTIATRNPSSNLERHLLNSTEAPRQMIGDLFKKCKYGEEMVEVGEAADTAKINELFKECMAVIDDTITMEDVKPLHKMATKFPKLKDFTDKHCNFSTYMFQVKKCGEPECPYCKPPKLSKDEFKAFIR